MACLTGEKGKETDILIQKTDTKHQGKVTGIWIPHKTGIWIQKTDTQLQEKTGMVQEKTGMVQEKTGMVQEKTDMVQDPGIGTEIEKLGLFQRI